MNDTKKQLEQAPQNGAQQLPVPRGFKQTWILVDFDDYCEVRVEFGGYTDRFKQPKIKHPAEAIQHAMKAHAEELRQRGFVYLCYEDGEDYGRGIRLYEVIVGKDN